MEESQLAAQLGFLESLRERTSFLLEEFKQPLTFSDRERFIKSAKELLEHYSSEYFRINELLGFGPDVALRYITHPRDDNYEGWWAKLQILLLQIDKGIAGLQSKISPLSLEKALELNALKDKVQKNLKEMPEEYKKNIREAIEEAERAHFLGSTLISGRVIVYALDQIRGSKVEDKIENLKKLGLVDERGEISLEYIMKADRKARHYFSHDIKALPDCNDALELLAISVRILELLRDYRSKEKRF